MLNDVHLYISLHQSTMTNTLWAVRKLAYYDITYLLTLVKSTPITGNHTFNLSSTISYTAQMRPKKHAGFLNLLGVILDKPDTV